MLPMRSMAGCVACRDALEAGTEQGAELAPRWRGGICPRHLHCLLAKVPEESRGATFASVAAATAAWAGRHRSALDCAVCAREETAAELVTSGQLCLHHLRRSAGRLTWEALLDGALRLLELAERCGNTDLPVALWGNVELVDLHDGHDWCPVCAARTRAGRDHFEWLVGATHLFPSRAAACALALCPGHAWRFAAWSPGAGQVLPGLTAEAWARRLRWLITGLEHRPADRIGVRLAALPATLSSLMDDAGRLPLVIIVRATAAALLRTPDIVLAGLVGAAFATEDCPACAAEDRAAREAAASCEVAVCVPDLRVVRSTVRRRRAWETVKRATVDRVCRDAASEPWLLR